VIISHDGGFKSLYGHLSKFNKKFRNGSTVKQGDIIGFVGNSGVSSGPHLHFGMYKNTRAMDPLKLMSSAKKTLSGGLLKQYLSNSRNIKAELERSLDTNHIPLKLSDMALFSSVKNKKKI